MSEQAELLALVDDALTVLEKRYGRLPSVEDVRGYLHAEHGVNLSSERVKQLGDDVQDIRRKGEEGKP